MTQPRRPEDLMPDGQDVAEVNGVSVRKGTAAAFLANVKSLDRLAFDSPDRPALIAEVRAGAQTLRSLGLFEVFAFRSADLAQLIGAEG